MTIERRSNFQLRKLKELFANDQIKVEGKLNLADDYTNISLNCEPFAILRSSSNASVYLTNKRLVQLVSVWKVSYLKSYKYSYLY